MRTKTRSRKRIRMKTRRGWWSRVTMTMTMMSMMKRTMIWTNLMVAVNCKKWDQRLILARRRTTRWKSRMMTVAQVMSQLNLIIQFRSTKARLN